MGSTETLKKRIGISGGTFDPIHYGHLIVAEEIREGFGLEKVIFIPAGRPPHKRADMVTEAFHRYNMVKEAIKTNPFFEVSTFEIDRNSCSYTVDTLEYFMRMHGSTCEFFFIVGADVIPELLTWKNYCRVFALCEFLMALRPGYDKNLIESEIESLKRQYGAKISVVDTIPVGISSTHIRDSIKKGRSIRYLVPEGVEKYIYEHRLYM